MNDKEQNLDLKKDAQIKIEKLRELAKDIEKNNTRVDLTSRQLILTAVIKSENEILWRQLETILIKDNPPEIFKTVIIGLLTQKEKYEAITQYAGIILQDVEYIDEKFKNQESLFLLLDALVKALKNSTLKDKDKYLLPLMKLYIASCSSKCTDIIADKLLQRCINTLPCDCKWINEKLIELIKNKDNEINPRVIAIDILGRSKPIEFFPVIQKIVDNIKEYTNNNLEELYFWDVITKFLNGIVNAGFAINVYPLIGKLKNINNCEIFTNNIFEDKNTYETITRRIEYRIQNILKTIEPVN